MESMGVVVRRYLDFLILLIPTIVSALFGSSIPTFLFIKKMLLILVIETKMNKYVDKQTNYNTETTINK